MISKQSKKSKNGLMIIVGSNNPTKISAVKKGFSLFYKHCKIKGIVTKSYVSEQPKSLAETVKGAKNRAKNAFVRKKCDFSVGLEAGIIKFPCRTGYMDICVAVLFDGKEYYYGGSSLFEYPKFIVDDVIKKDMSVGDSINQHLKRKSVGRKEGVIGWLSRGKIKREDYMVSAIEMALVSYTNKRLY